MSETKQAECSHKFVHLDTARWTRYSDYNTKFVRVDKFFCERCLETKELRKEEYSRDTPDWYRTNSGSDL